MPDPSIRAIAERDIPTVITLLQQLAAFEKMPDECEVTSEQLHDALLGEAPLLYGRLAESDGEIVGAVLWFPTFATFRGAPGVVIDKIYIKPEHRDSGIAHALFQVVARECTERGYTCIEGRALDWNKDAVAGYQAMGAVPLDGWTTYRLDGESLRELAGSPA